MLTAWLNAVAKRDGSAVPGLPALPAAPAPVGDFAPARAPRIRNTHINYPFPNQPRPPANLWLGEFNASAQFEGKGPPLKRSEGCEGGGGREGGGASQIA